MKRVFNGARSALAVKFATGFAVASLAVVAASAATEAAITGSADPANWGQQVKQQVIACKTALEKGQHGIGQCVSAFASHHGQVIGNGNSNDQDNGPGASNGKGKGKGQGNGHGQTSHKTDHAVEVSDGA